MMYYRMFGFVFSDWTGWPCSGASPAPLLFCSAMLQLSFPVSFLAHLVVQHPINCAADRLVNDEKINPEKNHRNDHNQCRCLDLSPAGKGHLPHFIADIGKKTFGARGKLRELVALVFARHCY